MNVKQKRIFSVFLTLLLAVSMVMGGCQIRPQNPGETTAAPFQEKTIADYEQFEEQKLKAQQEFDRQMEDLFREELSASQLDLHFLLKNPEAYGITETESLFGEVSLDAFAESQELREKLSQQLNAFDPVLLTEDQKMTLRILQSFLRTEAMGDGMELYAQPLASTIGIQAQLPILLSEYAFYDKQDVEHYLQMLAGIDEYYQEIMEFEKQKAEAGLMMSDTSIDHVIESCESYLLMPGDNFLLDTFNFRLEELSELTEEEKNAYRQQNEELIISDFIPAYQLLIDGLTSLKGTGTNDQGLCGFPNGKAYYKYLVYSSTGTSYPSVEELLRDMETTMENALFETSELLRNNPQLVEELNQYQFRQNQPEAIIEELKTLTLNEYPELPQCSYTFKNVPKVLELSLSPAFYVTTPIDDYQNNVIYINNNPRYAEDDLYNIIAHEGYPGHLYQTVYFRSNCQSDLRQILSFPGYSEGWASYVERESYMLDNGLSPQMGQLLSANSLASLGLHACLDVYINYMGWTKEQVSEYLKNHYQQSDEVVDAVYCAMVENPSNYLSYYVGCMEILNMRKIAEKELKDRFDLKKFHRFILDMGPAPFDVIQPYFTSWLMKQKL